MATLVKYCYQYIKQGAFVGLSLARLMLFLAVALVGVNSAWADSCKAVDRYLKWRGGDAYRSLQTLEMNGAVSGHGRSGDASLLLRRDGYSLQSFQLPPFSVVRGLTPDSVWGKLPLNPVRAGGAAQYRESIRALDQELGLSLQGMGPGEVSCPGKERRRGRIYNVIRVTYADGNCFDYLVSPKTGALSWVRRSEEGVTSWVRYRDWRRVDGVRIAKSWTHYVGESPLKMEWDRVVLNRYLAPTQFAMHPQTEGFCEFQGDEHSSGWIDFEFYASKQVMLDAAINGVQRKVLLDSASVTTVIDKAFAEELGLTGQGDFRVRGTSGEADATFATDVVIKIGNLTIANHPVAIVDLSEIGAPPLSVILGAEVFNELVVDIDYPNERLAFHEPHSFDGDQLAAPIEVLSSGGAAKQVMVSLNGDKQALVRLDTGLSFGMLLFKPWVDANGILEGMKTRKVATVGIGGNAIQLQGTVDSIEVGDQLLKNVPVNFSQVAAGSSDTAEVAGLLGTQIFRRYRTTFDLSRNLLYLTPPE